MPERDNRHVDRPRVCVQLYLMEETSTGNDLVLVVDDEPHIAALVAYHLAKAGYRVSTASSGPEALATATRETPALVILDLMLPGMSGFEVLRKLRANERMRKVAVLMLTARGDEPDRIQGLTLGADDYLTKPFSPQEMILRVKAILRRLGPVPMNDMTIIGPISIDRSARRVCVQGRDIDLTPIEYRLLVLLADRNGQVQERSDLLETVWDAAPDIQTRTVDMHVQRLRMKLGIAGEMIETVRGFGYRFNDEALSKA